MSKIYRWRKAMTLVYRFFIVLVVVTSLFVQDAFCSSINLFLKQAPAAVQRDVKKELVDQASIKIDENNEFNELLPALSGFIALYGGYVNYSDKSGMVVFPRLQESSKLSLIVTPKIDLETIEGNTIAHKKLAPNEPANIYLFEQLKEESEKNANKDDAKEKTPKEEPTSYWRVSKTEKPANGIIENLSIVLLTDPKNIIVPTGDFMTKKSANLSLPDIHVVENKGQAQVSLDFLDQKRFFEQIKTNQKVEKEKNVSQSIIGNP